ncbi:hypothetical protein ASE07_22580 [Noviherbaspirillum sp. Root189]|nr:hypothetical protein ASE07_22580 [Noviherbaspirillum sp. Root189]
MQAPLSIQSQSQSQSTDEARESTPPVVFWDLDLRSEYEDDVDTPPASPHAATFASDAGASEGEPTRDQALTALYLGNFEEAFWIDNYLESPALNMETFVEAALTDDEHIRVDNDSQIPWAVKLATYMHDQKFSHQHIGEFINALINYHSEGNPPPSEKVDLINALFTNMRPFMYEHIDLFALNRGDKLRFLQTHLGADPGNEEHLFTKKQQLLAGFESGNFEQAFDIESQFDYPILRMRTLVLATLAKDREHRTSWAAGLAKAMHDQDFAPQHIGELINALINCPSDSEGNFSNLEKQTFIQALFTNMRPFMYEHIDLLALSRETKLQLMHAYLGNDQSEETHLSISTQQLLYDEERLLYDVDGHAFPQQRHRDDTERIAFAKSVDLNINTEENRSLFFQVRGKLGVEDRGLLLSDCARVYLHLLNKDSDSRARAASLSAPEISFPRIGYEEYEKTPSVHTAKALLPKILDLRATPEISSPAKPGTLFMPIEQRNHPELETAFNQILDAINDNDPKATPKRETLAEFYLYCVAALSLRQDSTVTEIDAIDRATEITVKLRPFLDSIGNMHLGKERSKLTGILAAYAIGEDNTLAKHVQELLSKIPKFPPLVIALLAIFQDEKLPEPLIGLLGNQRWKKTDHFNAVLTSMLAISASAVFTPEQKEKLMKASFATHDRIPNASNTSAQDFQRHMYIIKAALSLFPKEEDAHRNNVAFDLRKLHLLLVRTDSPEKLKAVERMLMRELLQLHDISDARLEKVRSGLLSKFRRPEELLLYLSKLKPYVASRQDQRPHITLANWISVYFSHDSHEQAEHAFEAFRNDFAQSPQLAYLDEKYRKTFPETLDAWHELQSPVDVESPHGPNGTVQPPKYSAIESIKATDLFLAGSECAGSCQSLDGGADMNVALLGYATDGKTRMLTIKPKGQEDAPIVARRLLRIMEMESDYYTGPAIMLEQLYKNSGFDKKMDEALIALARNKAIQMKCPLMSEDPDDTYKYFDSTLFSKLAGAGVEYVDALRDKMEGSSFSILKLSMVWGPDAITLALEKEDESDDLSESHQ